LFLSEVDKIDLTDSKKRTEGESWKWSISFSSWQSSSKTEWLWKSWIQEQDSQQNGNMERSKRLDESSICCWVHVSQKSLPLDDFRRICRILMLINRQWSSFDVFSTIPLPCLVFSCSVMRSLVQFWHNFISFHFISFEALKLEFLSYSKQQREIQIYNLSNIFSSPNKDWKS
jgi:hypothetical protein